MVVLVGVPATSDVVDGFVYACPLVVVSASRLRGVPHIDETPGNEATRCDQATREAAALTGVTAIVIFFGYQQFENHVIENHVIESGGLVCKRCG